ncbi:acyl carrier protein [Ideonella sp. BN130291]|uniref:acyl carrier protein n=1 Tax=Ideonella sp. BN130291 TaxID=3112940 RepID=UPI002E26B828|nr:acyl carrier protein [Ideonella sp. BN130291]
MTDIKAQVRAFIQDNFLMGAKRASYADGDSFMAHHLVDSTGFLELVMFLEETFGFTVEDEEMVPENLDSLDNIGAYVARKTGLATATP